MRYVLAGAVLLCGTLAALPGEEFGARADDLILRGRVGDVFIGIDTRDRVSPRHGHHGKPGKVERDAVPRWRSDKKFGHRRPGGDRGFGSGPVNDFARDRKRELQEAERRHLHRHFPRKPHRPKRHLHQPRLFPFLAIRVEEEDEREETEVRAAPPTPQAPEAARFEPPDPRGPEIGVARGQDAGPRAGIEVGQPLPAGRPHVALDWRDYDLPRPPPGQAYARFAGAVLRMDSETRVVREIVWPTD